MDPVPSSELQAVARRLLGSHHEAEDAVQETWIRYERADRSTIDNPPAWLRTVLTRVCFDRLRARASRREQPAGDDLDPADRTAGPEDEVAMADEVGRALLVVLDRLTPAERVAFVLHDLFAVPFTEIGPLLNRSADTTKKLASRARGKVRDGPAGAPARADRAVVGAFLAAARSGELEGLLAVLDPDVVRRADPSTLPAGVPAVLRGARAVAEGTVVLRGRAQVAELAVVDGRSGLVVAPAGRLLAALTFDVVDGLVAGYEVIADPARLAALPISLPGSGPDPSARPWRPA